MHQPVVLIDLQHQQPDVQQLQQLLERYAVVYLFHPQGHHPFSLDALTDLAQLIYAQDVVILEHAATGQAQYDYALVAGQLMALLPSQSEVHLISAMPHAHVLLEMLELVGMQTQLISTRSSSKLDHAVEVIQLIESHVESHVKKWQQKLISSLPMSVRNLQAQLHPVLQGTLQHCESKKQKLQRKLQDHPTYHLCLTALNTMMPKRTVKTTLADVIQHIREGDGSNPHDLSQESSLKPLNGHHSDQTAVQIDPLQFEVAKHLHQLKANKPKDIYALRDFLEASFPESDVRRLLKELLDKGYIYCDGVEVRYSHEMYVN